MRKNVIWRWIALSLIDKGERSPEMIRNGMRAAECRVQKACFSILLLARAAALRVQNNSSAITYN